MLIKFLVLAILTVNVSAYAIEGLWRVTDVEDNQVSSGHIINMEIKNFIFRNTSLRWSLTVSGCQTFKYMIQVIGKNIYVDINTLFINSTGSQNCSEGRLATQRKIQSLMRTAFSFKLVSNLLAFVDAEQNNIIKFERVINSTIDITGAWLITNLNFNKINQLLQIDDKRIIFCQRQANVIYKLQSGNKISFTNYNNGNCSISHFAKVFKGNLFYVKRNYTLQFYNQNDQMLASMNFILDLQTARNQRQQQAKMLASQPTAQKIFRPNSPPQSTFQSPSLMSSSKNSIIPQTLFPVERYYGKWPVLRIVGKPYASRNIQLVIAKDTIILSSQCYTFIQPYELQSTNPYKIKRLLLRQATPSCKNAEDRTNFRAGLNKIAKLQLKNEGKSITLTVKSDSQEQLFYSTKQNEFIGSAPASNSFQTSVPLLTSPNPSPVGAASLPKARPDPNSFKSDKYTILLLKKRQIPRKLVNIQNNSFQIRLCNEYKISLQISDKNKIRISNQLVKTNTGCSLDEQSLYLDFFSKARTFTRYEEESAIIVQDEKGEEIITFNYNL